jgi:hypothetical protein
VTGATGPTGAAGANGTNGTGANGTNGTAGANGTNGTAGANGTNGTSGTTGATGPTGAAGANGTNGTVGATGPTGPAGSGGGTESGIATNYGKYTLVGSTGGLASGKQESGGWSANIHAPAASLQEEASGVASFPIPLKFHEKVKLNYRNESEALLGTAPCTGSVEEPVISAVANFCAYRGGKSAGAKEAGAAGSVDKEAKFIGFQGFAGETITETGTAGEGDDGVLIVFRTNTFNAAGAASEVLVEADLHAIGSWAVVAK